MSNEINKTIISFLKYNYFPKLTHNEINTIEDKYLRMPVLSSKFKHSAPLGSWEVWSRPQAIVKAYVQKTAKAISFLAVRRDKWIQPTQNFKESLYDTLLEQMGGMKMIKSKTELSLEAFNHSDLYPLGSKEVNFIVDYIPMIVASGNNKTKRFMIYELLKKMYSSRDIRYQKIYADQLEIKLQEIILPLN